MMKIYLITKPNTTEVYIGQTKESLIRRLQKHFAEKKLKPNREIYQWLDNTCIIELLEEFDSNEQDLVKEMNYVQEYIANGFIVKNIKVGKYILDQANYIKTKNDKFNSNMHPDYISWKNNIAYKAKQEGILSKEYRIKYNIPDYTELKKIYN